ncbi:MGH1-like glycoside hydrolase domain-containing protein, partial [Kineococcus aurantiacus]
ARLRWLQKRRPDLTLPLLTRSTPEGRQMLLSLVDRPRLVRLLERAFDPDQFLSPYGLRSLSAAVKEEVWTSVQGQSFSLVYEPGESHTGMFGGNSNWRGPIWFPVNVLVADKLRTLGRFFGDDLTIEVPRGSGRRINLVQAADLIDNSLVNLFRPVDGRRPADGQRIEATDDPLWRDHITFNEYFDGDTGEGLGATHQTGWTALVAHLLHPRLPLTPPGR